jgi:hypothetical protein
MASGQDRGTWTADAKVAIETTLFIREVFHLPLRQTEGLVNSLARVMGADISIQDLSCISKCSIGSPRHALSKALAPVSLVIMEALPQQKSAVWISPSALSRMTNLGMLISVKI